MNEAEKYSLKYPVCSTAYSPAADHFTCKGCSAPTVVAMNTARAAPFGISDESSM